MGLRIAIAGRKGGAGASTLARNVAVFLAQVGKRTALADLGGSLSGMEAFSGAPGFRPDGTVAGSMRMLSGLHDLVLYYATGDGQALVDELGRAMDRGDNDVIVTDSRWDGSPLVSSVFRSSPVRILVTAADPVSVRELYACASAVVLDEVAASAGDPAAGVGALIAGMGAGDTMAGFPSPRDLMERAGPGGITDAVMAVIRRFRIGVVVNMAAEREDLELGSAVESVGTRIFALPLVDMGSVERDEAIPAAQRRRIPLLVHMPYSKAGRDVEALVRRLLGTPDVDRMHPRISPLPPGEEENLYEALEVDRGAGEHDVRRAAKRIHEIFGGHTAATVTLGRGGMMEGFTDRAGRAQKVLVDRGQKRDYDRRLVQAEEAARAPAPARPSLPRREQAAPSLLPPAGEAAPPIPVPPQGATGAWLAGVRRDRGMSLEDVSGVTKVSVAYLAAIEAETWGSLPEPVYVRGFVTTFARTLGLDAEAVAKSYLELMRAGRRR